jgi:hypothetical protein
MSHWASSVTGTVFVSAPNAPAARGWRDDIGETGDRYQGVHGARYAESVIVPLGIALLTDTILYLIPRTAGSRRGNSVTIHGRKLGVDIYMTNGYALMHEDDN